MFGLSPHRTSGWTKIGLDHVRPWSVEREKWILNWFIHTATTSPVSGTTSINGSYCAFQPLHVQR